MASPADPLDRRVLSFAQAEGREPLPSQLQLGELSQELRSYLWLIVFDRLQKATHYDNIGYGSHEPWLSKEWEQIVRSYWIRHEHRFADEFKNEAKWWKAHLAQIFKTGDYIQVFGFIQFVLRHPIQLYQFEEDVDLALKRGRAAYRVVDKTIMPMTTPEEGAAVARAFADLEATELGGARAHLRKAGELLSNGLWADSARESIHAVESVVIALAPSGKTLSDGLKALDRAGAINPNLKRAMNALYDYSSDEKGIRHAKVLEGANVDEWDALYMFGSCAAFVTYLVGKLRRDPQ